MAEAVIETVTEERVITEEVEQIHLIISREEAETLKTIFMQIGGNPKGTRRGHVSAISSALTEAGIEGDVSDIARPDEVAHYKPGTIYFVNPETRLWGQDRPVVVK